MAQHFYYQRWPGGYRRRSQLAREAPRLGLLTRWDYAILTLLVLVPLLVWFGAVFARRDHWINEPGVDGVDSHMIPAVYALNWIALVLYDGGFLAQKASDPLRVCGWRATR